MSLETRNFEFGEFCLEAKERILTRQGKPISLTPKALQMLFMLVENHGHIVEKEELMQAIWGDSFVEESNLTFTVSLLRKTLSDDKQHSRFIETVPKRGYRFVAEVREIPEIKEIENNPEFRSPESAEMTGGKFTPRAFPTKLRKYFAAAVFGIFLIGLIGIFSWYIRSANPRSTAPILSAPFALEKLSTNGKVNGAALSPDGKMVAYSNATGGRQNFWLRQLDSGNNVEIIPPSDDLYYEAVFSPDGNFIYFVRRPESSAGKSGLYRISIFGGVPTQILSEPMGWIGLSPDGKKISFTRCYNRNEENCSLWIADAQDGKNERKIASRPRPIRIDDSHFSPDGKKIIFAVGQSENASNEFGLTEIDLETGAEREFTTQKFFAIRQLVWLPDQSGLLLTASRIPNKNFRIWQISAASGEVSPLTKDSESYSVLSLDKEATVMVATQIKEDFHLRLFNLENSAAPGKVLASGFTATFAPNGKIIFSSPMTGNDEIWSMNADGSEQRQLTNDPADEALPLVSPDGLSIFFTSNRTGEMHVWRMNFDGSNQTQITRNEGGMPIFVSPDGKWVYYYHSINRTIWRVSSGGGGEQLILGKGKYRFAFSSDGSLVAFEEKQGEEKFIFISSIYDGKIVKKLKLADPKGNLLEAVWLRDAKSLLYVLTDSKSENYTLWLQPFDDRQPPVQIADLGTQEIMALALAPDGKSFIVVQGDWRHDAVLIKGLK